MKVGCFNKLFPYTIYVKVNKRLVKVSYMVRAIKVDGLFRSNQICDFIP